MTQSTAPGDTEADRHGKMLDKVAKLLRQAEDADHAGRVAEAEAFQGKAFALMANHGISAALARARKDGLDITTEAKADSVYVRLQGKYVPMQRRLLCALCEALHCDAVGIQRTTAMNVYGMRDHLQRLSDMWTLLAPQAQRGMETAHPGLYATSSEVTVYRRSWLEGFANVISQRISKAEDAAAAAAGELVLYKSDKRRAEEAMHAANPKLVYTRSQRSYDPTGYMHGTREGQSAHLHRGVE